MDLKVGPDGALYYLSRGAGMVMRVAYNSALTQDKAGSFLGGYWLLDRNGNFRWDGPGTDGFHFFSLGYADEIPGTGAWDGWPATRSPGDAQPGCRSRRRRR